MQFRTLLCPISLSTASGSILRSAAYLAHRFGGNLRILHVVDDRVRRLPEPAFLPDNLDLEVGSRRSAE